MIVFVSSCPVAIDFKLKIKLTRTNKFKGMKVGSCTDARRKGLMVFVVRLGGLIIDISLHRK